MKLNDREHSDNFEKEKSGLQLLSDKSPLKIPAPLLCGTGDKDCFLVMEYLEEGKPTPQLSKQLGEGLADLHRQTQSRFGLSDDNYIGSLPQSNQATYTWAEFYATQRILPLLQKAFDKNLCTATDSKEGERLCRRFNDLFPVEPPALLHGDL